jgi:hypothetical protein
MAAMAMVGAAWLRIKLVVDLLEVDNHDEWLRRCGRWLT